MKSEAIKFKNFLLTLMWLPEMYMHVLILVAISASWAKQILNDILC